MAKRIQVEKVTIFGIKSLNRLFPNATIKWLTERTGRITRRDSHGRFLPSKEFVLADIPRQR